MSSVVGFSPKQALPAKAKTNFPFWRIVPSSGDYSSIFRFIILKNGIPAISSRRFRQRAILGASEEIPAVPGDSASGEIGSKMANISAFSTNQVFKSREDLMIWVQNVARSQGYVIVTKRSKAVTKGFISKIVLGCDLGGVSRNKDGDTKKINCPFELVGKYLKAHDRWTLRVKRDEHNHEPSLYMEGHAYAMRLTDKESRLVKDLTDLNVKPRDILPTLKEQNQNNVSSLRTIYNFVQKLGRSRREERSPIQNVMHVLQTKGYNFEYRLNNTTNELEELFFIHPTSFKMWQAFPYVVLMDATYKTNKYNLPFLEIVGVTSTNKTFSIAFAFMHNEQTSNYRWTLTCLKLTINNSFCPRVIVTDRDLALMKACEDVFPESNHLLCRWHIFNDITKRCRPRINLQKTWGSLHAKWKKLVESPTEDAYMENYENLRELLFNHADVFDYLYSVWLGNYAERFVSLWTDRHVNFGNSTTNRVESQHAKLKKHMESRKCDLDKFIHVIEKVVQSQETAIKESFTRSIIVRKPRFKDQIFDKLRRRVSNHAMDKILEELHRSKGFFPNPENCGCQMRTCYGLPCAHELAMYVGSGSSIPLDSVDAFWRKLDLSPSVSVAYGDLNIDHRMERLKETFDSQPDHIKFQYIRRMEEITDPSKILINEPSVKKNTRGRPKMKRVQHEKQAPHRYSCSDLHQQPPMHNSSFVDLNIEPSRHSSYEIDLNEAPINQCSYMFDLNEEPPMGHSSFLNEIPSIFHPYITHIQNVMGDGNCGFRSIAVCLGYHEDEWLNIRQQLHEELRRSYHDYAKVFIGCDEIVTSLSFFFANKPAPPKHWMLMPETGILIANTYGVVVQFLTNQGSATFFPLWRGPNEFENHRVITFALVYNNHYVMVQLEGECPMPPISVLWTRHKTPPATLWETMYKSRLQFYKQLKPTERCFMTLDD
ncbi:hypothetical protein LXL04_036532 [Taraxacum kok-saghyz]